jgi:hypothetical protein
LWCWFACKLLLLLLLLLKLFLALPSQGLVAQALVVVMHSHCQDPLARILSNHMLVQSCHDLPGCHDRPFSYTHRIGGCAGGAAKPWDAV